jgi:quinol monooxygenase YgiN
MVSLAFWLKAKRRDIRRVAAALQSVLQPAQLDRGCLRCGLMAEVDVPGQFFYFEEWASEEELKAQLRSTRFAQLFSLLETAAETPRLEIRALGPARGLDYIREFLLDGAADSSHAVNTANHQ